MGDFLRENVNRLRAAAARMESGEIASFALVFVPERRPLYSYAVNGDGQGLPPSGVRHVAYRPPDGGSRCRLRTQVCRASGGATGGCVPRGCRHDPQDKAG